MARSSNRGGNRGGNHGSSLSGSGGGDHDDDRGNSGGGDGGTGVATKTKPKTKKPSMYRVLLMNDDYTPMEFVIHVLERYFNKDSQEATQIMLHVHQKGIGVCGIFPYEIAETKVMQVTDLARKNQHPLQCTMEKV
ncbi:MAG: ATP-dependent Clp protease adapter ClpS [Rhodospirillaceae bacterium]|jgi:ATP-dependent Clp protease adaptor protein ClpS|nr:ATP-dependent Clp protease adapter ClpS [Rhodospirillaceae bacterium]MBT6983576.1 ATP-dependent Clp protease adapter ClpS [Rhodospirillaceae bacterium]MBT7663527.1 ATP-dependent Clp protease adapter ClpS [Rhodospirillaceae bacterium]MBT7976791.1 ATP-dependent Clp protease adapter ClpS [Rhodospirillaceae bacterium]